VKAINRMKQCLSVILLIVMAPACFADGAGVLIFTKKDNQLFVLLADHKKLKQQKRGWSTLGGSIKPGENDLEAAIREVYEESNGIIKREELAKLIKPSIKTVTPGFVIYFAEIDFRSSDVFNQTMVKQSQNGFGERGPFIWLPWQEILIAAKEFDLQQQNCNPKAVRIPRNFLPADENTDWFFDAFLATIDDIVQTKNSPLPAF